ncbi:hypothetical protein AB6Q85_002329 [Vibrio cholerae]
MLEVLSKYKGKPYVCGVNDCHLMILELTGFDINKIKPFRTLKEGRKALVESTGFLTMPSYLSSKGYQKTNPRFICDGCILLKGVHCFVYFDGLVFGVSKKSKTFEWCSIDLNNLEKFEVYEWLRCF